MYLEVVSWARAVDGLCSESGGAGKTSTAEAHGFCACLFFLFKSWFLVKRGPFVVLCLAECRAGLCQEKSNLQDPRGHQGPLSP